ncbi:hypothetical protein HVY71_26105 (plasmid) [Citrobacter freundii]|uniref:hypothetical protein n=1 Tax=Enterobacterales TaxID=91347 RepID=UPI001353B1D4|nr:hypothetical protein [Escherichia coli]EBV3411905.1 hypothetical protein [Salmonella enterica subsp. enterica serovar Heidelberg]EHX6295715.1 hypothetical protein [Salmonella enterica]QMF95552.1 hypothetical protein HVY71_26105 [Citrobacter freundii]HCR2156293.1 hypothetical protein [Enterobacter asburiae]HDR2785643.1 hypothetical protein [Enterobacter sichuanensis]
MQSILNVTYPATFSFSFTKAEIQNGKAFMNTYGIKKPITVNSYVELEAVIKKIAEQCKVNPTNVSYKIAE